MVFNDKNSNDNPQYLLLSKSLFISKLIESTQMEGKKFPYNLKVNVAYASNLIQHSVKD